MLIRSSTSIIVITIFILDPYHSPIQVEVSGRLHNLDPPTDKYLDPTFQRAKQYQVEFQAEWIYGYNGTRSRNNIYVLPATSMSTEILYFVSKVVVIYNEDAQRQRFYLEHTDEIQCAAQHPSLWIFATGQGSGGNGSEVAHVRIWDSKILQTLNTLDFEDPGLSIECLDFCRVSTVIGYCRFSVL